METTFRSFHLGGVATRAVYIAVFEKKPGSRTDDPLAPRCGLRHDTAGCWMRAEHLPLCGSRRPVFISTTRIAVSRILLLIRMSGFATFPGARRILYIEGINSRVKRESKVECVFSDTAGIARSREQGYLLLGLLFLTALLFIALAIAAPKVARQIQREKEVETVHRGEQYKRAVQLYYRKFGSYPMSMDQLKQTNQIRFLRQEYIDPMTGKNDWKLLHLGEVPMQAMGLFGQPLASAGGAPVPGMPGSGMPGAAMPGAGMPGAGMGAPAAGGMSGAAGGMNGVTDASSMGSAGGLSGSSGLGSNMGSTSNTSGGDSFFNDSSSSNAAANGGGTTASNPADAQAQQGTTDTSSDGSGAFSDSGQSGSFSSGFGGSAGPGAGSPSSGGIAGSPAGATGAPGSPSATGAPGASGAVGMFGSTTGTGAPIIGVTVPLKKAGMISYRKKTIYNKWYFIYNPAEDLSASGGGAGGAAGTPGTPAGAASPGGPSMQGGAFGGGIGSPGGMGTSGGMGPSPTSSGGFGAGMGSSTPSPSPMGSGPQ